MFPETSRYHEIETATMALPDGREVKYLRRRFSPQPTGRVKEIVPGGRRLDLLATEYIGDPKQFWKLCDYNRTLDPQELEVEDAPVSIPDPIALGGLR